MKITIKKLMNYSMKINFDNTEIDLGILGEEAIQEIAEEFVWALWQMGPSDSDECIEWILGVFEKCGIELR